MNVSQSVQFMYLLFRVSTVIIQADKLLIFSTIDPPKLTQALVKLILI